MKLCNLGGSTSLAKEVIEVYWSLRNLSFAKDNTSNTSIISIDQIPYSDILEQLERRLISLLQSEMLVVPSPDRTIHSLFANASILHIYVFLRDISRSLPFVNLLSLRIRQQLEAVDISKIKMQYPEMLLWICMMAGICGSDVTEKSWFATLVAEFCLELGICGGNEIAALLSEFFWSDLYRAPTTRAFWEDVARAQGFDARYDVQKLPDHVSLAIFNSVPDRG